MNTDNYYFMLLKGDSKPLTQIILSETVKYKVINYLLQVLLFEVENSLFIKYFSYKRTSNYKLFI